MYRNAYIALAVVLVLALFSGIEWLFLTVILLFIAMALVQKIGHDVPFSAGGKTEPQFQQPVVIQTAQSQVAHTFYTELVNNIVQNATEDARLEDSGKDPQKSINKIKKKLGIEDDD